MKFVKFVWGLRALAYKLFFGKIGLYCYIGKPTFIDGSRNITLGNKVRIFPGLRVECHNKGRITIGDDVAIAQNFHITSSKFNVVIHDKTTILGNVFITNIDHDYQEIGTHIMDQRFICKETIIGRNCFIGFGAAIQAGTILGEQCIVGANSVVRGSFPDKCVIAGVPAKIIKKYNEESKMWERV